MTGIKLSPKHGLNPTMAVCFFCRKDRGIEHLGQIGKEDPRAPERMVIDYEPCDECRALMEKGITLISVTSEQPEDGRWPVREDKEAGISLYPDGRWCVIKEDAALRILRREVAEYAVAHKKSLVDGDTYNKLVPAEKR